MKYLLPFSWLYAIVMALRNKAFDWRVLRAENVGVPVISVGNLTVGGTGKTPLVEYLVGYLIGKGRRVGVVSRGYKRKTRGVIVVSDGTDMLANAHEGGDEPVQIASKFRNAIVVVGEKRIDAARKAVSIGANVIVLDDGFQHRYLQRDLDIIVLDGSTDITKDHVLPAGKMRESLNGLRRAHVAAFSNPDEIIHSKMERMVKSRYSAESISYRYVVRNVLRGHDDGAASLDVVKGMQLLAFSGIGKHSAFIESLRKTGIVPLTDMRFSDHHPYGEKDIETLVASCKAMKVDGTITTEKDITRLRSNARLTEKLLSELTMFYLQIEVEILGGEETLHALIENTLRGKSPWSSA